MTASPILNSYGQLVGVATFWAPALRRGARYRTATLLAGRFGRCRNAAVDGPLTLWPEC